MLNYTIAYNRDDFNAGSSGVLLTRGEARRMARNVMRNRRERVISAAAVVAVIVAITGAYLLTRAPAAAPVILLPTPGPARAVYTNTQYGYSMTYPTDWQVSASPDGKTAHVFLSPQPGMPEDEALDILVYPNPQRLSSQAWWQANHPSDGSETAVGQQTLKSGASAYVSQRQAQSLLKIYTIAVSSSAIQIISYQTGTNYDAIIGAIVNSFTLQ